MTVTHHHTPPPAPKQGMSTGSKVALFGCGGLVVVGALLFGGCAIVGGAVVNEVDKQVKADASEDARAAEKDVKITTCKITDEEFIGPGVDARVIITNHGKKRANYLVEGEFLNTKGDKVGELYATVNNLAPGKSTSKDFGGLITADDLKGVTKGTCSLVNVTRDEWLAAN